jgi:hypothetical protein
MFAQGLTLLEADNSGKVSVREPVPWLDEFDGCSF